MLARRSLLNAAILLFLLTFTFLKLADRYKNSITTFSQAQNGTFKAYIAIESNASNDSTVSAEEQDRFGSNAGSDVREKAIDWSRFAYVLYATESAYLCNSVMLIEQLHRLGAKPDLVLLYPDTMDLFNDTINGPLIEKARDEYGAVVKPVQILHKEDSQSDTWAAAHTKFLAFNQTDYDRVLHLDSDATIQQPMDELFLLPPTPMAMPRAYWISQSPKVVLCSSVMLMKPSSHEFDRVLAEANTSTVNEYDMDMVNDLYRNEAMVLPHHSYMLLTGEFRDKEHKSYLGEDDTAVWDPDLAIKEAKYVHFSDWPVPKPWIEPSPKVWRNEMPKCYDQEGQLLNGTDTNACRNREIWVGIYDDFKKRRVDVCGADFVSRSRPKLKIGVMDENVLAEQRAADAEMESRMAESDAHDVLELRSPEPRQQDD